MTKKIIILFAFALLISGVFLVSSLEGNNKVSEEVYDALQNEDKVRVIIKLKDVKEQKGFVIKVAKERKFQVSHPVNRG